MDKVLFVCLGNICRSPMAEGVFKEKVKNAGLEASVVVSSAATSQWEVGNAPHQGTQSILKQQGIDTTEMHASKISKEDFNQYNYIIGMDHQNIRDLKKMAPKESLNKIHLFMSVVPGRKEEEVPDPYYTGDFEETYAMVNVGTDYWLHFFENE